MSRALISILCLWLFHIVKANPFYALTKEKIYLQLENDDLVSLNFSITGESTPDKVYPIAAAPKQAELFLVNDELYGMKADEDEMALVKYNSDDDTWQDISLDLEDLNDKKFYQECNYLTSPGSNDVYVYGGIRNEEITNRLISINFDNFKASNISTTTKPQSFYGAANLLAPDPSTQLLIGGESLSGWLNMYQLATWDFQSGWSFQPINKDNTTASSENIQIDSRKNAQALPIFGKLQSNNESEIANNYKVEKVLVIGGNMGDSSSSPGLMYLNVKGNTWNYEIPDSNDFGSDYSGIVTIFNNILTISKSNKKRSNEYEINYFDLEFNKQEKVSIPELNSSKEKENDDIKESIQQKAILGTVIPISAILIMVTAGYFIMKKRKKNLLQQEMSELSNHFAYFNEKEKFDNHGSDSTSHHSKLLYSDSNSTLDVNSIDSWVRKRQEYDNHKFMNSQETLNNGLKETQSVPENMTPYSPITPKPLKTIDRLNKSVVKLKKSISFSNLPSPERKNRENLLLDDESNIENYDNLKNLSYTKNDLDEFSDEDMGSELSYEEHPVRTLDPNFSSVSVPITDDLEYNQPLTNLEEDSGHQRGPSVVSDYESTNSITGLDVQVLVSSKRRSVLRIMNPDNDTMRQRVPSNERETD